MHVADLAPLPGSSAARCPVLAVGWLEAGEPYATGRTPEPVFRALMALAQNPWEPAVSPGVHACSLCQFADAHIDGHHGARGATTIYVPTEDRVHVAPSLITHYIDAHACSPPTEVQAAVLACPPMRSMPYLRLLVRHGLTRG
jgi:hypothetical protein